MNTTHQHKETMAHHAKRYVTLSATQSLEHRHVTQQCNLACNSIAHTTAVVTVSKLTTLLSHDEEEERRRIDYSSYIAAQGNLNWPHDGMHSWHCMMSPALKIRWLHPLDMHTLQPLCKQVLNLGLRYC